MKKQSRRDGKRIRQLTGFRDSVAFAVNHMPMPDETYSALLAAIALVDKK